jgi:glycosyltransferase involved in cell wall biosynthesis
MKSLAVLLNYPLQNQIDVGHLDVLLATFENALNEFDEVHVISPRDDREYDLGNPRIKVHSNGCTASWLYYPSVFKDAWKLYKIVRENNARVIRLFAPTSGLVGGIVGRLTRTPVLLSVHTDEELAANDSGRSFLKSLLVRFAEPLSFKLASKIGVISGHIRGYALRKGASGHKLFNHHNFVDTRKFKPISKKNKAPVFVFVGRFTPVKSPLTSIKAFERVLTEKDAVLWLVGDGPQLKQAKHAAKPLGKKVKFYGRVEHSKLPAILAKADYFIAPATAGFTLIEAFSCGLPAAAADLDWSRELVRNGKTGYLAKAYDAGSLANACLKLLRSKKSMRNACRRVVEKDYSLRAFKERELCAYRGLQ